MAALLLLALVSASAGAGAGLQAEMRGAMRWYAERGGVLSPAVEPLPSAACGGGLGLFATTALEPLQVVGSFPLGAALTAACALEDAELGPAARAYLRAYASERGAESIVLAAFLAHVRARTRAPALEGAPAAHACAPYVDSLPWGDGHGSVPDSLAHHPLLRAAPRRSAPGGGGAGGAGDGDGAGAAFDAEREALLAEHAADARTSAREVAALLASRSSGGAPADDALCLRAVLLVASRTFDFSAPIAAAGVRLDPRDDLVRGLCVAVPVFDCLNHPSVGALAAHGAAGERFQAHAILDSCLRWRMRPADAGAGEPAKITVHAPTKLAVEAGDELWQWYGNAGWGEARRDAWIAKEAKFLAQYGFLPWA